VAIVIGRQCAPLAVRAGFVDSSLVLSVWGAYSRVLCVYYRLNLR